MPGSERTRRFCSDGFLRLTPFSERTVERIYRLMAKERRTIGMKTQEETLPLTNEIALILLNWQNALWSELEGIIDKIDTHNSLMSDWENLRSTLEEERRERWTDEPVPRLTVTEQKIYLLMGMRLSTRQIAHLLHRTPKSIMTHMRRIRKKLQRIENDR
jgi:DNA-directed RNA polymerase specialized sigma24 family protein